MSYVLRPIQLDFFYIFYFFRIKNSECAGQSLKNRSYTMYYILFGKLNIHLKGKI